MAQPIVSWWPRNNANDTLDQTQALSRWDIGVVDAGTISTDFGVLIWNNRKTNTGTGVSAVSDMENCTITTKDSGGGNSGPVVTGQWIEVRVDSADETSFNKIGGNTTRPIKAKGVVPDTHPTLGGQNVPSGFIMGTANDGVKANSSVNFAEVTLHANVPSTASAGYTEFVVRVTYQYV